MKQILQFALDEITAGRPVVWASIIASSGSTPRSAGARMLIRQDGSIAETIGGGLVEAYCEKEGAKALAEGTSRVVHYRLTNDEAAGIGMICGGNMSVLMEVIEPVRRNILKIEELLTGIKSGARLLRVTHFTGPDEHVTAKCYVINKSASHADRMPHDVIVKGVKAREPFLVTEGEDRYLVEPASSRGTLYLLGAGHVAYFTARTGMMTGFKTIVIDDRNDFANTERYPEIDEVRVIDSFDDCFSGDTLTADCFVVIVTRGHKEDKNVLAQCLKTDAGYIGMIGSTKKREATYRLLREQGFTDEDFARVTCPVGLKIGADTPEEIAVSITAELIAARAGKL